MGRASRNVSPEKAFKRKALEISCRKVKATELTNKLAGGMTGEGKKEMNGKGLVAKFKRLVAVQIGPASYQKPIRINLDKFQSYGESLLSNNPTTNKIR
jgi:hypothetical protein